MSPLRIGVLLSGSGRTLENFLAHQRAGQLPVEIACVIASRADVRGARIGRAAGRPTLVCRRRDHPCDADYGRLLCRVLAEHGVELVTLAGFLHLFVFDASLEHRVLNIHPSLLPAFGGAGWFGDRVHQAVYDAGVRFTGCTVHFADRDYDRGPIVIQRIVPIEDPDTPHTIAARVFAEECIAYPEAIRLFAAGRLRVEGNRVRILGPDPGATAS